MTPTPGAFALAGRLDLTFGGGDGIVAESVYDDLLALPDGKLLVGNGPALRRLNEDGTLDLTFHADGEATLSHDAYRLARLSDGRIVVIDQSFELSVLLADGDPDTGFDGDGSASLPGEESGALVVDGTNRIVVAGSVCPGGPDDPCSGLVVRILDDGTYDATFGGGDGMVELPTQPGGDDIWAAALQADGKILAGGRTCSNLDNPVCEFAVYRLESDGDLDTSFGDGGIVRINNGEDARVRSLAVQADGKILAIGSFEDFDTGVEFGAVFRLLSDGQVDATYGIEGFVRNIEYPAYVDRLTGAVDGDGRVLVAARFNFTPYPFGAHLFRLTPNGGLDTTFEEFDEFDPIPLDGEVVEIAYDGKIYLGGDSIARLHTDCNGDGVLDAGEECDLGAENGGVACSALCEKSDCVDIAPCAEPDGWCVTNLDSSTACDDGSICSSFDHCDGAGSCIGEAGTLATGCDSALVSKLLMKRNLEDPSRDQFVWQWKKGTASNSQSMSEPTFLADTTVCVYHHDGTGYVIGSQTHIPARGICDDEPCWTFPESFTTIKHGYRDLAGTRNGITQIAMKMKVVPDGSDLAPVPGGSSIVLKGKGSNLPAWDFPWTGPSVVQLFNHQQMSCFQSSFDATQIDRATETFFKARNP